MNLNNQNANSTQSIAEPLNDLLDKISSPSFSNLVRNYGTRKELLFKLVNDIDRPILKGLVDDALTVLSNWFEDPEVVCCLIQGLWAIYAKSIKEGDFKIGLNETEWAKWIDLLISFVDLIIVFLTNDIKKFVFFIPDIFKELMNGVMGAILLVLQEVLFTLSDSLINGLISTIDKAGTRDTDSIWAKCLPLNDLLRILKKYFSDYGLFADLFAKIKGFISGKVSGFSANKKFNLPLQAHDLEFLYWFRNLLIKIKQAAISFDLCVSYEYKVGDGNSITDPTSTNQLGPLSTLITDPGKSLTSAQGLDGLAYTSDRSILIDRNKWKEGRIPLLSNSSIRNFLHDYMGYPYDKVDMIITGSFPSDNITGTNINSDRFSNLNADCPNTPDPNSIIKWAMGLRDRKK